MQGRENTATLPKYYYNIVAFWFSLNLNKITLYDVCKTKRCDGILYTKFTKFLTSCFYLEYSVRMREAGLYCNNNKLYSPSSSRPAFGTIIIIIIIILLSNTITDPVKLYGPRRIHYGNSASFGINMLIKHRYCKLIITIRLTLVRIESLRKV